MNFCLKAVVEFGGNVGYVDLSGILKFEIEPMDMNVLLVGEKTKVRVKTRLVEIEAKSGTEPHLANQSIFLFP